MKTLKPRSPRRSLRCFNEPEAAPPPGHHRPWRARRSLRCFNEPEAAAQMTSEAIEQIWSQSPLFQ